MLPDFKTSSILVIGDIMLDRYYHGSTHRISPEAPVPVIKQQNTINKLGGAANVALNIATLGVNTALMGYIGNDEAGNCIKTLLADFNIQNKTITQQQYPTTTKLRVISRNQQLLRIDSEETITPNTNELSQSLENIIEQHDLIVLSDYAKGALTDISELISIAKKHNKPVLVDPKGNDFSKYNGAELLTPNRSEFETIVGKWITTTELAEKAASFLDTHNIGGVLVTLSEEGMALFTKDKKPLLLKAKAKEVYDVTGAGDTVISCLAAGIASSCTYEEAANIANEAAAIVIGKLGTATVSVEEIRNAIQEQESYLKSIVTEKELLELSKKAKNSGQKIIMTNGCFDLLHPGHIAYLNQAASLGDKLIVAVNSDDSVKRLKGKERPINNCSDRMQMLAALKAVDWVVEFSEDTPERIIAETLPNVLVKGGDYKAEDIAGYNTVTQNGGEVKILKFLEGYSSSKLIEKINQA